MSQKRPNTLTRAAVLVVGALLIVALAVMTNEPFDDLWASSEATQEAPSAAGSPETE